MDLVLLYIHPAASSASGGCGRKAEEGCFDLGSDLPAAATEHHAHDPQDQEDPEEDVSDVGRGASDAAEAEDCRHKGDNEEYK
jgi:hypothetical protein